MLLKSNNMITLTQPEKKNPVHMYKCSVCFYIHATLLLHTGLVPCTVQLESGINSNNLAIEAYTVAMATL